MQGRPALYPVSCKTNGQLNTDLYNNWTDSCFLLTHWRMAGRCGAAPLPWPSAFELAFHAGTPTGRLCLGLRAGNSHRYSNWTPLPWPSNRQFTQVLQQDASALAFEQAIHAGTPTGRLCLGLRAGISRRYSNRAHSNACLSSPGLTHNSISLHN